MYWHNGSLPRKKSLFPNGIFQCESIVYIHLQGASINNIEIYQMNLTNAVYKRCSTTDRPIACLLSGRLDSSLITALVCSYFPDKKIETYSIGMEGSVDLKYAQKVADFEDQHTNIVISKEE